MDSSLVDVFCDFNFLMKLEKNGVFEFQFGQSFFTIVDPCFCSDMRSYL
jgi:hypothetical protein